MLAPVDISQLTIAMSLATFKNLFPQPASVASRQISEIAQRDAPAEACPGTGHIERSFGMSCSAYKSAAGQDSSNLDADRASSIGPAQQVAGASFLFCQIVRFEVSSAILSESPCFRCRVRDGFRLPMAGHLASALVRYGPDSFDYLSFFSHRHQERARGSLLLRELAHIHSPR
jgi:hypothetical protein